MNVNFLLFFTIATFFTLIYGQITLPLLHRQQTPLRHSLYHFAKQSDISHSYMFYSHHLSHLAQQYTLLSSQSAFFLPLKVQGISYKMPIDSGSSGFVIKGENTAGSPNKKYTSNGQLPKESKVQTKISRWNNADIRIKFKHKFRQMGSLMSRFLSHIKQMLPIYLLKELWVFRLNKKQKTRIQTSFKPQQMKTLQLNTRMALIFIQIIYYFRLNAVNNILDKGTYNQSLWSSMNFEEKQQSPSFWQRIVNFFKNIF